MLKLFLDCDNCVFVLAIDYAVVSQGVKQKYGELIGEEKGKSFFDKIIQVPFKMPVAQYDVKNYVTASLQALGIAVSDVEAEAYVKLNTCGFWLNNKTVHADSRDEIIQYFVSILPSISKEIEEVLRG